MYKCADCGLEFSRKKIKEGTEFTVCPACESTNYGEVCVCMRCGKHIADGTKECREVGELTFCEKCIKEVEDRVKDWIGDLSDAEKAITIHFIGGK